MGGKTKQTTTSDSTRTVAPPSWTMPGIQLAADRVNAAAGQPVPQYTGDFVAGANYQPAIDAFTAAAQHAPSYADWTDNAVRSVQPSAWHANNSDQQIRGAIEAGSAPVIRQLMQQVLPGIRSSAMDAGAYSGDRASAILPQLAMDDASRNIGEIASKYVYDNTQAMEDRSLQAWQGLGQQNNQWLSQLPSLVDTAMRMRTAPGDLYSQAAALDQQQRQQVLDNALQHHQYDVMRPYEGLDIATQLLTQLSGNYGTTTGHEQQTQVQQTSGLGPILQAAMGAAGMAFGMPMGGGGTLGGSLFGAKAAPAVAAGAAPTRNIFPG